MVCQHFLSFRARFVFSSSALIVSSPPRPRVPPAHGVQVLADPYRGEYES